MSFSSKNCPIPETHQRLRQAHILWHQAAANYRDVDVFLTNLNGLIQELRNVTFILQSEKGNFPNFDAWYLPWQESLKEHKHGRWLVDTRNAVVKQGTLAASSHFNVKFLTYDELEVASLLTDTQADLSILAVLERRDFQQIIASIRGSMEARNQGDAVIALERCWSTAELKGAEILGVLGSLYGLLANIVQDAHLHLGDLHCINADGTTGEADFPSHRLNSHLLPCMMRAQAARTEYFTLNKFEPLALGERDARSLSVRPADVEARYQIKLDERLRQFDSEDPSNIFDHMVWSSKKVLRKDKELARIMMLRDANGTWRSHLIAAKNRVEKYLLMHLIAQVVREEGCDALVEVGETWIVNRDVTFTELDRLHSSPNRRTQAEMQAKEAIIVRLETRDGLSKNARTMFERGPFGGIRLSDTVEGETERPTYLYPIYRVWAEQRRAAMPRGPGWLPEYGEPCICGSHQSYANCCYTVLQGSDGPLQNPDQLLKEGRPDLAERHARATITRYISWVRRHTVLSLNSANPEFAKKILPTDCLAIQEAVAKLERCVQKSDNVDSVSNTYRHLQDVVGIPEIARRLVALSAEWLLSNGREEEGLVELARLGKPSEMTDSRALVLSATHDDHDSTSRIALLERAVSFALSDEEKQSILLVLADEATKDQQPERALQAIDNVIANCEDVDFLRVARTLRWQTTGADDDLEQLVAFMKNEKSGENLLSSAAYLMDQSKPELALDVLTPLLSDGSTVAQLLAAECEIRTGECTAAAQRLDSLCIDDESSLDLRLGFAHVQALMVLGCRRNDLRAASLALLERLTSEEALPSAHALIEALKKFPADAEQPPTT